MLSVLIVLTLVYVGCTEFKKHVPNSVYPYDVDPPTYNIEHWVKQLHLQQCAFVEVGDKYYAMFVETRPRKYDKEHQIREYFLGLCDDDTLTKWSFCPSNLQEKRSADCDLRSNSIYGTRVHRRLCDVTLLSLKAQQCDCNSDLADSKLFKVQGFPTCFKAPLPDSLCGDNNVCGLAACKPETINKRIHSVVCDPECHHRQPFCEQPGKRSSLPREVHSFWTDWSNPFCTDVSCMSQFDEATCINKLTGEGDVDCLGPGTSCCSEDLQNCRCHIYEEDGVAKVFRTFSIPPPELVEYMSEEDFINSIPLRYLNKEEYHKYPYNSPRTVRANAGRAMKKAFLKLYEHRPIKFGNTHSRREKKQGFKHLSSIKKSVINHFKPKRGADIETTTRVYHKVNPVRKPKLRKRKLLKGIDLKTTPTYLDNDEFCGKELTTTESPCDKAQKPPVRNVKLDNYDPNDNEFCGIETTSTTEKECLKAVLKNSTKRECNFTVAEKTTEPESMLKQDDKEMEMDWEDKIDSEQNTELDSENYENGTETVVTEKMLKLGANVTLYTRSEETEDDDGNPTSTDNIDSSEAYHTRRRKNIVIEVDTDNGTESVNNTKMESKNKTRVDHNNNKTAPLDAENEDYEDFPKAEPNECNQSKKILNKLMKFFKISSGLDCDDATKSSFKRRGIEDISDDDEDEDDNDEDILIEYVDSMVTTSTTTGQNFEKGEIKGLNVEVEVETTIETSTERNFSSVVSFNFILLFLIYF